MLKVLLVLVHKVLRVLKERVQQVLQVLRSGQVLRVPLVLRVLLVLKVKQERPLFAGATRVREGEFTFASADLLQVLTAFNAMK